MKSRNSKRILPLFNALTEGQKKEVYDFIEFLSTREIRKEERKKKLVDKVYGLTRGSKLTSELFSRMKAAEVILGCRVGTAHPTRLKL
ncbi:MAG TPA: hypothetical protein ACFYD5_02485 [Candidatus Tripitaka sp. YC43]